MVNIKYIIYTLLFALTFPLWMSGQNNLQAFTEEMVKQNEILKQKQKEDIDKFMEVAYKRYTWANDDSLQGVPIYSVYAHERKVQATPRNPNPRTKNDLFVYLNPKNITLESVCYFKNDVFKYWVKRRCDFEEKQGYSWNGREEQIGSLIQQDKPEMVFVITEDTDLVLMLKHNEIYCYKYNYKTRKYVKMTPQEFIDSISEEEFIFIGCFTKPEPVIYVY